MSAPRIVRGADLRAVPWRNGQGTTRDVLAAPGGARDWQISIADLVRDAPFSDYAGMDRTFTVIAGAGVELSFGDLAVPCPPLLPVRFAGEAAPACRLRAGPGRAFNVFADRLRFRVTVAVLRLAPDCALPPDPAATALHCVEGRLALEGGTMAEGDTLVEAAALNAVGGAATLVRVAIAPA